MTSRLRGLGIVIVVIGFVFVAAGAFAFIKTQEGNKSLAAFSAAQGVELSYSEDGTLDGENPEQAAGIMSLLTNDWGYPVVQGDLNPNDPLVNTATEYMYQMATVAYHTLNSTQTVVITEPTEFNGETIAPGEYEFAVDGRYWADFNRANPIEAAARGQAWTGTAHALIAELGVGTATASTLQLALALAGLFAGLGGTLILTGAGLVWATRAEPVKVPALRTSNVTA